MNEFAQKHTKKHTAATTTALIKSTECNHRTKPNVYKYIQTKLVYR